MPFDSLRFDCVAFSSCFMSFELNSDLYSASKRNVLISCSVFKLTITSTSSGRNCFNDSFFTGKETVRNTAVIQKNPTKMITAVMRRRRLYLCTIVVVL